MTYEVRLALQLILNLAAILLASWLAGRYAARRVRSLLEIERQRAEDARRQALAEALAGLPPIPPEVEQIVEIERWVLNARDLQVLLVSLCSLVRVALGADKQSRRGVLAEIARSLKFLGRLENKWLNSSLPVVAYVRQLDPDKGKAQGESLEAWLCRINRTHVQASQSLRRAASLCEAGGGEAYGGRLTDGYLSDADRMTVDMAGVIASALDRIGYLQRQLPERQAVQVMATVDARVPADPVIGLVASVNSAAR